MSNRTGARSSSYAETIEGLKKELESHVANIRSATEWADFERLYRALCTVEELAGARKTTLEELLDLLPANVQESPPQGSEKKSSMELGEQLETETDTEIEKGS